MQTFIAMGLLAVVFTGPQNDAAAKAFEHYEAIRVALAADEMKDVAKHAAALSPIAQDVAGAEAKNAADAVASAKDIAAARQQFAVLSTALVPAFEKAGIKDVHFFVCTMPNGGTWAQRGKDVQNPYMGKSMLTCGSPKK